MNNLFLFLFLFLNTHLAVAQSSSSKSIFKKTFYHDKSYCQVSGEKFNLEIRGNNKYGSADIEYGEHLFINHKDKIIHLPLNQDGLSRYRFFNSRNNVCSKSLLLETGQDQIALFFLKDNRPLGHTLSVVHYNLRDSKVFATETSFSTQKGFISEGKFFFQTSKESLNVNMGQVKVNHANLIFKEDDLPLWHTFDGSHFKIDPSMTYKSFQRKVFFKDQSEFEKSFKWDSATQQYHQLTYYFAVKKIDNLQCLSFNKVDWHCPSQKK